MRSPIRFVASPVNTGSVSGLPAGFWARRIPTPGRQSPGTPWTTGTGSPVPTHTSSFVGSSLPAPVRPHSTHRQAVASGFAMIAGPAGSAGRHPPIARQVVAPSAVYQTPPVADAAYARRPSFGSTHTSITRPVIRGLPDSELPRTAAGPMGCHRSAAAFGAACGTTCGPGSGSSSPARCMPRSVFHPRRPPRSSGRASPARRGQSYAVTSRLPRRGRSARRA